MPKFLQAARDKARVIVDRERPFFTPGAMSMYALALVAEAPVILARYLLALLVVFVVLVIEGNIHGGTEWALVALLPTAWSAIALFNPAGGAWWWQTRAGGREPSKREQLAYQDAIELLQTNSQKPLPLPRHWFVIDNPSPDAAVCGDTLMVSRGLLETNHLPAVLAHELGHLASPDARLTTAINRLIVFSTPFRAGAAVERSRPQIELVPRLQYTPRPATDLFDFEPGPHTGAVRVPTVPVHPLPVRERRPRTMAHRPHLGPLLARARVQGRPIRRGHRTGRRARGLPRDPRPDPRQPDPVSLAHTAHPPTHGAENRPASASTGCDQRRKGGTRQCVAPGPEPVKAAPTGPLRGPDGLILTEPGPSAKGSPMSAGPKALPTWQPRQRMRTTQCEPSRHFPPAKI
jgi:Peptidase family M48